jgi:hypothetical protein
MRRLRRTLLLLALLLPMEDKIKKAQSKLREAKRGGATT